MANYLKARWFKNGGKPVLMFIDKTKENPNTSKAYRAWIDILYRVRRGRFTICDEWLDFLTFRKWFYENVYDDTRLLFFGDKRYYSPDTVEFVPNSAFRIILSLRKGVIKEESFGDNLSQFVFEFKHHRTNEKTESPQFSSLEALYEWVDDFSIQSYISYAREREIASQAHANTLKMMMDNPLSENTNFKHEIKEKELDEL